MSVGLCVSLIRATSALEFLCQSCFNLTFYLFSVLGGF